MYSAHDANARNDAEQIAGYINAISGDFTIRKLSVIAELVECNKEIVCEKEELRDVLHARQINALYLLVDDQAIINDVLELTRTFKINSISNEQDCLKRGVAFQIAVQDGKPKLLVNVAAAKKEGSDYSSKLLSLCERIENGSETR